LPIPSFEGATFSGAGLNLTFYTPERESARQTVTDWIRNSGEFDAVVDFDEVLRDPGRPTQLHPAFASEDHLHVNDAGNVAQGNAIPLALFRTDRNPHLPSGKDGKIAEHTIVDAAGSGTKEPD